MLRCWKTLIKFRTFYASLMENMGVWRVWEYGNRCRMSVDFTLTRRANGLSFQPYAFQILQNGFYFLKLSFLYQLIADFFDMRNSFQIIAVMPAHLEDAQHRPLPFDGAV